MHLLVLVGGERGVDLPQPAHVLLIRSAGPPLQHGLGGGAEHLGELHREEPPHSGDGAEVQDVRFLALLDQRPGQVREAVVGR